MAYTNFKARDLEKDFNLRFTAKELFPKVEKVTPSTWLKEAIERATMVGFISEKARSERLVTPLLLELSILNKHKFTIHSGMNLDVDESHGLNGECDFILSLNKIQDFVKAPIVCIVEAKKNDIESGTIQCAAQLLAAQRLNKKENKDFDKPLFGCATTGVEWRFLELKDKTLTIGLRRYYIQNLTLLLGVFQYILNQYKIFEPK